MKIAVIFEGDPSLPDPDAGHPEGLVRGEFLPDGTDVLLLYREWGDQFEGGSRTHMLGGGAWENLEMKHLKKIDRILGSL